MPLKVMVNSIFEKTELGPSHVTKFGRNVWVHGLMLDAKYQEDVLNFLLLLLL